MYSYVWVNVKWWIQICLHRSDKLLSGDNNHFVLQIIYKFHNTVTLSWATSHSKKLRGHTSTSFPTCQARKPLTHCVIMGVRDQSLNVRWREIFPLPSNKNMMKWGSFKNKTIFMNTIFKDGEFSMSDYILCVSSVHGYVLDGVCCKYTHADILSQTQTHFWQHPLVFLVWLHLRLILCVTPALPHYVKPWFMLMLQKMHVCCPIHTAKHSQNCFVHQTIHCLLSV